MAASGKVAVGHAVGLLALGLDDIPQCLDVAGEPYRLESAIGGQAGLVGLAGGCKGRIPFRDTEFQNLPVAAEDFIEYIFGAHQLPDHELVTQDLSRYRCADDLLVQSGSGTGQGIPSRLDLLTPCGKLLIVDGLILFQQGLQFGVRQRPGQDIVLHHATGQQTLVEQFLTPGNFGGGIPDPQAGNGNLFLMPAFLLGDFRLAAGQLGLHLQHQALGFLNRCLLPAQVQRDEDLPLCDQGPRLNEDIGNGSDGGRAHFRVVFGGDIPVGQETALERDQESCGGNEGDRAQAPGQAPDPATLALRRGGQGGFSSCGSVFSHGNHAFSGVAETGGRESCSCPGKPSNSSV